jgi:hypothetical protein
MLVFTVSVFCHYIKSSVCQLVYCDDDISSIALKVRIHVRLFKVGNLLLLCSCTRRGMVRGLVCVGGALNLQSYSCLFFLRAAPVPRRPLILVAPLQATAASAHESGAEKGGAVAGGGFQSVNKPKPPVVKLTVVIKATWDEAFAEGVAILNGDAGVEGSRASRPLAMLRIGGQQLSLFEFCEGAALYLDTSMANEFASLKARRFFLEAGSRPKTCAPSTSVLRRRR